MYKSKINLLWVHCIRWMRVGVMVARLQSWCGISVGWNEMDEWLDAALEVHPSLRLLPAAWVFPLTHALPANGTNVCSCFKCTSSLFNLLDFASASNSVPRNDKRWDLSLECRTSSEKWIDAMILESNTLSFKSRQMSDQCDVWSSTLSVLHFLLRYFCPLCSISGKCMNSFEHWHMCTYDAFVLKARVLAEQVRLTLLCLLLAQRCRIIERMRPTCCSICISFFFFTNAQSSFGWSLTILKLWCDITVSGSTDSGSH